MLLRIYLDLSPTKPRYATSFASLNGCYQEAGSGRASDIGAAGYQQLRFLQAHQTTHAQPWTKGFGFYHGRLGCSASYLWSS